MNDGRFETLVRGEMDKVAKALLGDHAPVDPARIHQLQGEYRGLNRALGLLQQARKDEMMSEQDAA